MVGEQVQQPTIFDPRSRCPRCSINYKLAVTAQSTLPEIEACANQAPRYPTPELTKASPIASMIAVKHRSAAPHHRHPNEACHDPRGRNDLPSATMILRCVWPNSLLFVLCIFFSSAPLALAADNDFNCLITTDSLKFDLTSLGGEHTVQRERETPPSKMVDKVRFDLCGDLKSLSDVSKQDQVRRVLPSCNAVLTRHQCPEGARVCLSTTNVKEGEKDRIVAVIPIATSSSLQPAYSALSCTSCPRSATSFALTRPRSSQRSRTDTKWSQIRG